MESPEHTHNKRMSHTHKQVYARRIESKVGNILVKTAALWITLNIDDTPVTSRSHTHPSHSQTSRLITSSMSLGVTVPHDTQCMRIERRQHSRQGYNTVDIVVCFIRHL